MGFFKLNHLTSACSILSTSFIISCISAVVPNVRTALNKLCGLIFVRLTWHLFTISNCGAVQAEGADGRWIVRYSSFSWATYAGAHIPLRGYSTNTTSLKESVYFSVLTTCPNIRNTSPITGIFTTIETTQFFSAIPNFPWFMNKPIPQITPNNKPNPNILAKNSGKHK